MRVAHRLFLSVLPAVAGALAVAALCGAHGSLRAIAGLAGGCSLGIAWWNARSLAQATESRPGRAQQSGCDCGNSGRDLIGRGDRELDARSGEPEAEGGRVDAGLRAREHAALVSDAADAARRRIEEIRLPLHILLESRFGELNENQEEMLSAAQDAAAAAEAELRRVQQVVELDTRDLQIRPELVRVVDLVAPVLQAVAARGQAVGVRVYADVSPALPHVRVDRHLTHQALALVLDEALAAGEGASLRLDAVQDPDDVRLVISHGGGSIDPTRLAIAGRLLQAQGIVLTSRPGQVMLTLPRG
jgi:hypothetical protein